MEDLDRVIAAFWHADSVTTYNWFTLLCRLQGEAAATGDYAVADFAPSLIGFDRSAGDALLEVLADITYPREILAAAAELGPDDLTARYDVLLAQAYAAAAEDETVWAAYLTSNGPAWDRTDQNWTKFRDWFAYYANDAGVGNFAAEFLDYVEGSSDKIAAFAKYGVVLAAADADGFAEGDLSALFAEPELDDIAVELAGLDDAAMAALAADIAAALDEHQDH
ncbi:hypothetical protein [Amycolatopsis sp. H20-H5]|uniref:hypothetical protein n=1 Tax=Amycolatopsis sp. H20-H5 TaxID=3046309 RepID=UPI002DBAAE18|nr:hypothetical protein [Amycolatopsis sp. H20-H5]MEC3981870.1 hypothetical protein [Amycolatopsis sp. H20-H5]